MITYLIIILILPLIAFILLRLFGKYLSKYSSWISTFSILLSLALSLSILIMVFAINDSDFEIEIKWSWITLGNLSFNIGFLFNNLSAILLVVTATISSLVHIYTNEQLEIIEKANSKYFSYISAFTFSAFGIILTNNLFMLFFLWIIASLCSYQLTSEKSNISNVRQYFTLFFSDILLLIGILILFIHSKTLNFNEIFRMVQSGELTVGVRTTAGILIFLGVIGKSAQFPLHTWLSEAMTSHISAKVVVHSTGMISLGIYILIKVFPVFSQPCLTIMAYWGSITSLVAATIATTQTDIKQVFTYSAISHAGFMILGLGLGAYIPSFFYLIAFMFFNTLLLINADSVISSMRKVPLEAYFFTPDFQNIKQLGGLKKYLPINYWTFLIATAAISGLPLTFLFLSKNSILLYSIAASNINPAHYLLILLSFMTSGFTAFYIFRLFFNIFHGKPKLTNLESYISKPKNGATLPLILLSFLCLFIIYNLPNFNPIVGNGWLKNLVQQPNSNVELYSENLSKYNIVAIISTSITLVGLMFAWLIYVRKLISTKYIIEKKSPIFRLFYNRFYTEELLENYLLKPIYKTSNCFSNFDLSSLNKSFNLFIKNTYKIIVRISRSNEIIIDKTTNKISQAGKLYGTTLQKIQNGNYNALIILIFIVIIILIVLSII